MKIRIKSGDCPSYLTVGKVYEVVETNTFPKKYYYQYIRDDLSRLILVRISKSNTLNGGSWEIVNDEKLKL